MLKKLPRLKNYLESPVVNGSGSFIQARPANLSAECRYSCVRRARDFILRLKLLEISPALFFLRSLLAIRAVKPPVETVPAALMAKFAMQNGHMVAAPY